MSVVYYAIRQPFHYTLHDYAFGISTLAAVVYYRPREVAALRGFVIASEYDYFIRIHLFTTIRKPPGWAAYSIQVTISSILPIVSGPVTSG